MFCYQRSARVPERRRRQTDPEKGYLCIKGWNFSKQAKKHIIRKKIKYKVTRCIFCDLLSLGEQHACETNSFFLIYWNHWTKTFIARSGKKEK